MPLLLFFRAFTIHRIAVGGEQCFGNQFLGHCTEIESGPALQTKFVRDRINGYGIRFHEQFLLFLGKFDVGRIGFFQKRGENPFACHFKSYSVEMRILFCAREGQSKFSECFCIDHFTSL